MTEDIEMMDITDDVIVCTNCNSSLVEPEYKVPLCKECRDKLSNRPIPLWIKAFFGIIIIILIVSLTKFPSSVRAGVAYERGIKAENEKKYVTTMNEYRRVIDKYPDSTLALAKLGIAYYQNGRIDESIEIINKIVGREVDEDLIVELDNIADNISTFYYPNEELVKILNSSDEDYYTEELLMQLDTYVTNNPGDIAGRYYLANALYEFGKYDYAEKLIKDVIDTKPEFHFAYFFLASIYRDQERYDEALEYCKKVLDMNTESLGAHISMTQIELKRNNDKEALDIAKKAYGIDKDDNQVISNLSLAYHYNDMIKERDGLLNLLIEKNDEFEVEFLTSIFNGTYQWR